jgi:hypothetical protein
MCSFRTSYSGARDRSTLDATAQIKLGKFMDSIKSEIENTLIDLSICGIHFYGAPVLVIDKIDKPQDELFLTIETNWAIHKTNENENWSNHLDIDHILNKVILIRQQKIVSVDIIDRKLKINFDNGYSLSLKPSNDDFESWNLVSTNDEVSTFVGMPGGDVGEI